MGHALSAADVARAIRLVEPVARTMLSRSEMATLLSWLDVLPEELDRSQSHLSLFHAWALVLTGHLDVIEPPDAAAQVEELGGLNVSLATLPGELAAIRATAAYFRRDFGRAVELSEQALADLAEDNLFLRAALALNLGVASSWTGDVARASRAFAQAATISRLAGNLHVTLIALWNQGQLELEQGRLLKTTELYRQALELVEHQRRQGQPLSPAAGGAFVGLGCLLYERNNLAEAEQHLQTGLTLAQPGAEMAILTVGRIALSRLRLAQNDVTGAFETIRQAQELARQNNDAYWAAQAAAQQARLWLDQARGRGEKRALQAATRWAAESGLEETDPPAYLREVEHLVLARLLFQQGRQQADLPALEAASRLLERLRQAAAEAGRTGRLLEILALQALAYHGQNRPEPALAALDQALGLARPEGYQRLFLDEGPAMETLLRRAASRGIAPDYVNKLLATFSTAEPGQQPAAQALVEPLSERELEILHLVANGRSNHDIARELALTVGTVKWHLNNIYGQLNVRSRTQAVAQARRLRLL
jgi:LuxR family transcriptional regulator, maltose regulon positive regulatory protein